MKIFSPSNIELLLHCHCCPTPHPRIDAPAIRETIAEFIGLDILVRDRNCDGEVYKTTAKGAAWVEALCNVEIPRTAYVDGHGRVLTIENVPVSIATT